MTAEDRLGALEARLSYLEDMIAIYQFISAYGPAVDRAVAICHSRLCQRQGEGFVVARLSSNRFELRRTPQGWRVKSRINRLLDGSPAARAVLETA